MDEIKVVQVGVFEAFLVVNGERGPVQRLTFRSPMTHPAGYLAYADGAHEVPPELRGKVFRVVEVPPGQFEAIDDTACPVAREAYEKFTEVIGACTEVKLARYPEAPPPADRIFHVPPRVLEELERANPQEKHDAAI